MRMLHATVILALAAMSGCAAFFGTDDGSQDGKAAARRPQSATVRECEDAARLRAIAVNEQGFDAATQRYVHDRVLKDCMAAAAAGH